MRQTTLSDLHHAAIALTTAPKTKRVQLSSELLWRAHVADKFVKRLRKRHPNWGDGSLRAAAINSYNGAESVYETDDYIDSMYVVVAALRRLRDRPAAFCY